jgi:tRNA-specific 2-thiouridylase
LALIDGQPAVVFSAAEEGVAPGQACVLYAPEADSRVLGGGFIAGTVAAKL